MGFFDNISNNVLRQFMPDPSDPTKNFFIGDVINGQTLYLQDLFEILIMLFVTFLVIMAYLLITALLCYCLRKPNAKKRANKAKEKYFSQDIIINCVGRLIGPLIDLTICSICWNLNRLTICHKRNLIRLQLDFPVLEKQFLIRYLS